MSVQIFCVFYTLIHGSLASLEKYNTMCSWFLGHRGENAGIMKETMNSIVDQVKAGRMAFGSDDEVRIISFYPHALPHNTHPTLCLVGLYYHHLV
jgi:hypothetical protein